MKALEGHKHLQFYPNIITSAWRMLEEIMFSLVCAISGSGDCRTDDDFWKYNISSRRFNEYRARRWHRMFCTGRRSSSPVNTGCTQYDFGAIAPETQHKVAGITRFKQGFGGCRSFIPTRWISFTARSGIGSIAFSICGMITQAGLESFARARKGVVANETADV